MLRASFPRVPDTNEALPAGCRGRVKAGGVGKTCVHRKPMLATRREDWSIQLKTKDFTPLRGAWGLERRGSGGGRSRSLAFGDFSGWRAGVYMLLWVGSRCQGCYERVGKVATVLVRSDAMNVLLFVQTLEGDCPRTAVCLSKLLLGPREA